VKKTAKILVTATTALVASVLQIRPALGQSVTTEAAVTAGYSYSSSDVSAVAMQLRAFGEIKRDGPRFYVEGAWAEKSDGDGDSFGAAYPYANRLKLIEAYVEDTWQPAGKLLSVRAGRYRTPFGIYNGSDYAYNGFLRAPLIRYDGYYALSNNFLEEGADVVVGVPRFSVEASLGAPADVGTAVRRSNLDSVLRVQAFEGPFLIGVSHIHTSPYLPATFAHGHADFTGVDVRWMRDGVQLRGEWIDGRPFDGTTTSGWYFDTLVHRTGMGPVTAVARLERLDYEARAPFTLRAQRQTIGARVRLYEGLSVQVNALHETGLPGYGPNAVDVGLSYLIRRD
jgi:hypothetical protein